MKIKCTTLGLESNNYRAGSGRSYTFFRSGTTVVEDKEDQLYFLNACGGKVFVAEGMTKKLMDTLKKVVSNIVKGREKKEKEKLEAAEKGPEMPDEPANVFTDEGLIELRKKQQEAIIKEIMEKIPADCKYENHRVQLLKKLQDEGHDIVKIHESLTKTK